MRLNELFTSHMVFQAGLPVRVFGSGEGKVKVSFRGMTATAESENGGWHIELPSFTYGGPYEMVIELNGEVTTLTDIYTGEVILLAGQSNMQFKLEESSTPLGEFRGNAKVRLYSLARLEDNEYFKPKDGWVKLERENAGHWSAVGYHLGISLAERDGVAVGLIACYQGASVIESWIPERISAKPEYFLPDTEKYRDHFIQKFLAWNNPGQLYHAMTEKLCDFSVGRVIWYQGESNCGTGEGKIYAALLLELIAEWRKLLRNPALPFTVIQIADCDARNNDAWHAIQAAQMTVDNPDDNITVIKSADVCESDNIHPKTKSKLAARLLESIKL